jgi:hypothetical protein
MPLADEILDLAATNVGTDISSYFGKYFEPVLNPFTVELPGVDVAPRELLVSSNALVAVPWAYKGTHVDTFLGVAATGILITLRGATFVDTSAGSDKEHADSWTYSRYIDYLGALHQLGVTATSRPAFMPDDFAEVRKYKQSLQSLEP